MSEALRYPSTRGASPAATLSEAIAAGIAPDGGLYVPESLAEAKPSAFRPQRNTGRYRNDTARAIFRRRHT